MKLIQFTALFRPFFQPFRVTFTPNAVADSKATSSFLSQLFISLMTGKRDRFKLKHAMAPPAEREGSLSGIHFPSFGPNWWD